MPTITSAGVGSGLDVTGLVEQLVAAEGEPVRMRLDRKEAKLQAGLSAMGTFKGAVSEFQTALASLRNSEAFGAIEVTKQDEDIIAVTASNDAQPGEYEVEVIQLAEAQKLTTDAFDSDLKPFGSGVLTIQLGSYNTSTNSFSINPDLPPRTITIAPENSSLRGIQEAINEADAGVRASLINDGQGFRLALSALSPGDDNSIRITVSDDDASDSDLFGLSNLAFDPVMQMGTGRNLSELSAAQNAVIRVDGIEITRAANHFDDVLQGINLSLKSGSEGQTSLFRVELSSAGIIESVNNFISKYNEMINVIDALTGYNPETGEAGPLSGDPAIRGIASQLRRQLGADFSNINPTVNSLSSIGIDTQRNGTLSLNENKLRDAIENNRQELVHLFSVSGSASDPLVEYIEAEPGTRSGAYALIVNQLASQGMLQGAVLQVLPVTINEAQNSFAVKIDGVMSNALSLEQGSYSSAEQLASKLQSVINSDGNLMSAGIKVAVSIEQGRITITSQRYGSSSSVEIVNIAPGLSNILGLGVAQGAAGRDIQGSLNGLAGIGTGQVLTAKGPAEGLKVRVVDGQSGERGQVIYSQGVAARMNSLIDSVLDADGILSVRTDGYSDRIEDIAREREQLARKLETSEQRYLKQFTSLDATLGRMRSTSEYLNNQLSSLPGAQKAQGNK